MHIEYTENPLESKIILTDVEKELLLLKFELEDREDFIWSLYFRLVKREHDNLYDPEDGVRMLETWKKRRDNGKTAEEEYENRGYIIESLSDSHAGDCTCFPCSCTKCHIEGMLKIDTLKGAGKHMLHQIFQGFKDARDAAIPKGNQFAFVLEKLSKAYTMEDHDSEEWWENHIDRWNVERADAHKWLLEYGKEHGFV